MTPDYDRQLRQQRVAEFGRDVDVDSGQAGDPMVAPETMPPSCRIARTRSSVAAELERSSV
jgi:hypothetical protein